MATVFAHPNAHPHDSDSLMVDEHGYITDINFYREREGKAGQDTANITCAGLYIISPSLLKYIPLLVPCSFEKDILYKAINSGERAAAYQSSEFVMDAGTKDRLLAAEDTLRNNIPAKRNMKNAQRAVFLDRDGTVTRYNGFVCSPEQLHLEAGAGAAIRRLNSSEFLCVIVTNQSVVARGLCDESGLLRIHNRLETLLGHEGAYIDALKYCPHHPDKGYPEENAAYKIKCRCRKPDIALLEQSAEQFNINLKSSWVVGDMTVDIQTGVNAGARTILLRTGFGGKDGKYNVKPDYVCNDLAEAVEIILRK
jgi:histidinol-phosphate phosphatase family protein